MTWAEYWNRKTTIYVNARHRGAHYERISRDIIGYVPGPDARVVDYGCGDTLSAHKVAARCGHLFLCDSAPTVRASLAARYAGCPNISVIGPQEFEGLDPGSIDAIVVNSVVQYLSAADFTRLLARARDKLSRDGCLVLGDIVPRHIGPLRDATELFRFAAANGFLLAAAVGLVKSSLSSYPRLRREAGFLQFDEAEMLGQLEQAGFAAERRYPNIGHNTARMTFVAAAPDSPAWRERDARRRGSTAGDQGDKGGTLRRESRSDSSRTLDAVSPAPLWGRDRVGGNRKLRSSGFPPPLTALHKGEGNPIGASGEGNPVALVTEAWLHPPQAVESGGRPWTLWPTDYRLAACLFAAVWLFLSFPWLSGAATIPYDAKALFQAQLQFLANALHSGQSPFWNPSTFVGVPQIADPQSLIFSPAIVLAWLERAPSFAHLDAYVLALLGLGGLAMLKFCQDRGWHPAGGIVAAIAFAFGASAAWRVQHIAQIQSLAFFALTLWLLARALDRSSAPYGALAGLAAGLMVVEPNQIALLGCYVLAGYCASRWLLAPDRRLALRRSLRPLACGSLAAALVAALPVLLTFLFLSASNRPAIAFSEAARGSLHPASLLTGLVADLFGAIDPALDYWGPYSEAWDKNELTLSYNMSQAYIGTLPMLLVLTVGLTRGALYSRELRFYAIAVGVLLLYALGRHTPAFALFFSAVPGVSLFRRPVDALFLIGALLSVVAGYLVHLWATASLPPASHRRKALEAGLIAAILLAALATAWSAGRTGLAFRPLLLAVAWIAAASLLLAAPTAWLARSRRLAVAAPALLLAGDLALNNGPNDATALPASSYEVLRPDCRNDTILFLKSNVRRADGSQWRDRIELVGLGFEWQNAALVHGFDGTLGYNPFRLGEVSEATGARDYIAGPDQKWFSPLFPSYASMMANLLGLRFIVIGAPIEQIDPRLRTGDLKLVARTSDAYIYENPRALPRVLFVKDWKRADFDALTDSGDWPKFDPTRTVLLEAAPAVDDGTLVKLANNPARNSSVRIRRYENTKVEIEVDAAQSGFVVLHDIWHPWWTAEVDGDDVPILRANVLFRAVQVPAGQHIVTFEFRPIANVIDEVRDRLAGRAD